MATETITRTELTQAWVELGFLADNPVLAVNGFTAIEIAEKRGWGPEKTRRNLKAWIDEGKVVAVRTQRPDVIGRMNMCVVYQIVAMAKPAAKKSAKAKR